MKKEQIIQEMEAALERYKTIKQDEFDFGAFVSRQENNCGTICCLWGWEPKFGVLENVKWENDGGIFTVNLKPVAELDWGRNIIYYLYYDWSTNYYIAAKIAKITKITLTNNSTLIEVLSAWEKVIELLKTGDKLDEFLNLN